MPSSDKRPSLPREFYRTSIPLSVAFVSYGVGLFAGAGLLAAYVAANVYPLWLQCLLVPPLILVAAHGAHMLGFIAHEGIHLILFPNRYLSIGLATFLSAATTFSAVGYGISHWNHHRYTNRESDPDTEIFPPFRTFWRRFFLARPAASRAYLDNTVQTALGRPLPLGYKLPLSARGQRILAWLNLVFLGGWLAAYGAIAVIHPQYALFGIALPLAVVFPISGLRPYVEHAGTGVGIFRDSRSFAARLYTWIFFGNNFHLEHHLYPAVPCYHLPAVHRLLRDRGYFDRWQSPIDPTLTGPYAHTTSSSQYPTPLAPDSSHDPFRPAPDAGP